MTEEIHKLEINPGDEDTTTKGLQNATSSDTEEPKATPKHLRVNVVRSSEWILVAILLSIVCIAGITLLVYLPVYRDNKSSRASSPPDNERLTNNNNNDASSPTSRPQPRPVSYLAPPPEPVCKGSCSGYSDLYSCYSCLRNTGCDSTCTMDGSLVNAVRCGDYCWDYDYHCSCDN
jgi:hypothetical protein